MSNYVKSSNRLLYFFFEDNNEKVCVCCNSCILSQLVHDPIKPKFASKRRSLGDRRFELTLKI